MNLATFSAMGLLAAGLIVALPADAASLRLRCETRSSPARSKISVDGRNVVPNALFTARVLSGNAQRTSRGHAAEGDEVEFDFDSNPADIRAGATSLPTTFIRNRSVRAVIFNASGQVVAGPTTVACEAKR